MADVVLDESMFILGMDIDCANSDLQIIYQRAARVVAAIQRNHRWVVSPGILAAYENAIDSPKRCRQASGDTCIKSLKDVLLDAQRSVILSDLIPDVAGDYDPKDRHMVRAAAASQGCYLATMDKRLRKQLERQAIPASHGFIVLGLEDAEAVLL